MHKMKKDDSTGIVERQKLALVKVELYQLNLKNLVHNFVLKEVQNSEFLLWRKTDVVQYQAGLHEDK